MIIDKNLFYIDGIKMNKYPILQVTFGYPKMWGDDTWRDTLSWTFSGTFKGVYPIFTIYFGATDQQQIEELTALFDRPHVVVKYYDPNKKEWIEKGCYTPDYSLDFKRVGIAEGFNLQLTSEAKRWKK